MKMEFGEVEARCGDVVAMAVTLAVEEAFMVVTRICLVSTSAGLRDFALKQQSR